MSNNKQSSVEWLQAIVKDMIANGGDSDLHAVLSHIEQAKAMHKEEIENAFDIGVNSYYDLNSPSNWEQYYNETYGGNK
jgi:predicted metal-dependent peptidase